MFIVVLSTKVHYKGTGVNHTHDAYPAQAACGGFPAQRASITHKKFWYDSDTLIAILLEEQFRCAKLPQRFSAP